MLDMTPNILKNFLSKPATRLYPIEVRPPFEEARGALVNDIKECIFCGACQRKCPSHCIEVDKKAATWNWDPMACIYCGICVDNCPTNCLTQDKLYQQAMAERETVSLKGEVKKPKKKSAKATAEKS